MTLTMESKHENRSHMQPRAQCRARVRAAACATAGACRASSTAADKQAQNIELDHNELAQHLKHEAFTRRS